MHPFLLFILSAPAKAVVIIDEPTVGSVQGKNIRDANEQMFGFLMKQSKEQLEVITGIQQTQQHMMLALSRSEMPPEKKGDKKTGKRRVKDSEEEDGEDDEEALQLTKEKRGSIQSGGRPSQHMQMYLQQPQVQFQSFQPQFQFMQPLCQFQPGYQPQCPPGFQPHFQHHLQHQFPQLQFSQQSYPLQFGRAWP